MQIEDWGGVYIDLPDGVPDRLSCVVFLNSFRRKIPCEWWNNGLHYISNVLQFIYTHLFEKN